MSAARVLVLGSGGRLGQLLRRAWMLEPPAGLAPVYHSGAREGDADIFWRPGDDMTCFPACDAIIALWGITAGTSAQLNGNTALANSAVEIARETGAARVFHMSSAAVYGPTETPATEASVPMPASEYGRAKLAMEAALRSSRTSPHNVFLRLANIVGADSLAPAMRGDCAARIDRFDDGGGPVRSYLSPRDLARVLATLSVSPVENLPGVINIAAPDPVGMEHLLRAAERPFVWRAAPKDAIQSVVMDTGLLDSLLPDIRRSSDPRRMVADWRELTTS